MSITRTATISHPCPGRKTLYHHAEETNTTDLVTAVKKGRRFELVFEKWKSEFHERPLFAVAREKVVLPLQCKII